LKKVLVVEDEANIRLSIEICLEQAGYAVITAEDGISAVEQAIESKPDLILLDLILPKMNGYLVCEALKGETATRDIPVVAISARAQEGDIKKAREAGVVDYIVKPFAPEELRRTVRKYIITEEGKE